MIYIINNVKSLFMCKYNLLTSFILNVPVEKTKWHLPPAVVCPEGKLAFLPGAPSWQTPAGCHCAGRVCCSALGDRWTFYLLPGVWAWTQNLQICSNRSPGSRELGESSPLSQPLLPLHGGERPSETVWRCVRSTATYTSNSHVFFAFNQPFLHVFNLWFAQHLNSSLSF